MKFAGPLPWMGPLATPAHVAEAATTVEAIGYDSVAIGEHLFYPKQIRARYPYRSDGVLSVDPTVDSLEIFTTLAYVAARTQRLGLLTHVVVLPYRSPFLTAKLAANVDVLSSGRLTLGVGVGWLRDEFEVLGVDWHQRGKRTDDALTILRGLFEEDGTPEVAGGTIPPVHFYPKPVQRPLPIWIGGMGPRPRCAGWPASARAGRRSPRSRRWRRPGRRWMPHSRRRGAAARTLTSTAACSWTGGPRAGRPAPASTTAAPPGTRAPANCLMSSAAGRRPG